MKSNTIKYVLLDGAKAPSYQTAGAAGADICAHLSAELVIGAGEFALVPTGVFLEIPEGFEVQVRPRSGLASKFGVTVLNAPGTIDSDYRGEVKVILINHGKNAFVVKNGDRIAQLVVSSVIQSDFCAASSLSESQRGSGGFGSTGVRG